MGTSGLVSVGTELTTVGQRVDGLATFTRIKGQDACISRVADELGIRVRAPRRTLHDSTHPSV